MLGCAAAAAADDDAGCTVFSAMAAGRSRQDDVHNAMARRRRLDERTSMAAITVAS